MSANVRCVGLPSRTDPPKGIPPCDWKGERFAVGKRIGIPYLHWDDEDRKARTRKSCPQCGGRVELIPSR